MSSRSAAMMLSRSVRMRAASSRSLSTTRTLDLPRQNRPRPPPLPPPTSSIASSNSALPPASTSLNPAPVDTASQAAPYDSTVTPWFLEEEEDVQILPAATPPPPTHSSWSADASLPEPLSTLHYLLAEGDCSALIARPDEEDDIDNVTGKKPITYIHAKEVDEDAWADWIVVIQVRSNAGGSVSRVAKEVGSFLKHALPPGLQPARNEVDDDDEKIEVAAQEKVEPVVELERQPTTIDDFFGEPSEPRVREYQHQTSKLEKDEPFLPNGIVDEPPQRRPWRPFKIVSREAQDGIRALHRDDPERWNRRTISETFKISHEGVRRILKSKWKPTGQIIGRQNRRAMEREVQNRIDRGWTSRAEKEQDEVSNIRREMERDNQNVDEDEQEYRLQGEEEGEKEIRFTQPIFYEGLVDPGDDRKQGRGKSAVRRGDGEWCLVDAGWCVVHVMTAQARTMYDVESIATRTSTRTLDDNVA